MKQTFKLTKVLLLLVITWGMSGCQTQAVEPDVASDNYVVCPSIRAQMCTREYRPVCASVVVQCVTAPCPREQKTYGNACSACAEESVEGYWPGACGQPVSVEPAPHRKDAVR